MFAEAFMSNINELASMVGYTLIISAICYTALRAAYVVLKRG